MLRRPGGATGRIGEVCPVPCLSARAVLVPRATTSNAGAAAIRVLDNEWTVVTVDGKLAAHYENTICITDGEAEILTMADDI